jgi:hypothetical protein
MSIVRRGRQEKAVLEPLGEGADGFGELAIDRIGLSAGRGGMVRLIENEERARPEWAEAGADTTAKSTRLRNSISRSTSPASTVFPSPTSSAMSRFTRGSLSALESGSS